MSSDVRYGRGNVTANIYGFKQKYKLFVSLQILREMKAKVESQELIGFCFEIFHKNWGQVIRCQTIMNNLLQSSQNFPLQPQVNHF